MANLIPQAARGDLAWTLSILSEVAEALGQVFNSQDEFLLDSEAVRSGFARMAHTLAESITELQETLGDHLKTTECLVLERDRARTEAADTLLKLRCLEMAARHAEDERERLAPDLSEPTAPPVRAGATIAG